MAAGGAKTLAEDSPGSRWRGVLSVMTSYGRKAEILPVDKNSCRAPASGGLVALAGQQRPGRQHYRQAIGALATHHAHAATQIATIGVGLSQALDRHAIIALPWRT